MEPKVMIEGTCKNGHQTLMYPDDCVRAKYEESKEYVVWECARCPKDDFRVEVQL